MICCQNNNAVINGQNHRRNASLQASNKDDDDAITHPIEVIGIKNISSKHQANSALILNEYFAQKLKNDGKSEIIDEDEMSALTLGTKKDSATSPIYNLNMHAVPPPLKGKGGHDDHNSVAPPSSEHLLFDLPQSMLNNVREEDEYSA